MKNFEYKIFNLSEVEKLQQAQTTEEGKFAINRLTVMNDYGSQGWQILFPLTSTSYLMVREYDGSKKQTYPGTNRRI